MSSSTVINTNARALNSNRNLRAVGNKQDKASKRLSSGKKINSAADDAAGLAISEKMKAQIRGLDMASKNANDAISFIQTTEGYVAEINNMVTRIRDLAVQCSTDSNESADRTKSQQEVEQLRTEITDLAGRAQFNNINLNQKDVEFDFHIGSNKGQKISLKLQQFDATELGLNAASVSGDGSEADTLIKTCDDALEKVTSYRAILGAVQNRLEYTNSALETASENLSQANSRIEDADMAQEMTNMTSANVINQAAVAMLAQANQAPQTVLQLLS